jgi:phosphatidyl-myo-inositol alpha-mannosyltransferase
MNSSNGAAHAGTVRRSGLDLASSEPVLRHRSLRICVVVPYDLSEYGGVKHHALELARALRRGGDDVTIIGPATSDPQIEGVKTFGGIVNISSNASDNRIAPFVSPFRLRRFFKEGHFDIIHIHEPPVPALPYWAAWLTPGVPKVCTFHAFNEAPSAQVRLGQHLSEFLQGRFIHHALAVSVPAQRHASRAWSQPMTIIPNGVATDVFTPGVSKERRDRTMRLLFVGRLSDERKGLRYMIDAYQILRARGVSVSLDIVGEQAGAPPPPQLDGLRYHGPVSRLELVKRFRACDAFVAPSTSQESFGIVLLEAMATATPIVCSDIEGYRQVVDPRGAHIVPPRDAAAIAAAVEELARSPQLRATMGAINLRQAHKYDWAHVAARVRDEYLMAIYKVSGEKIRSDRRPVSSVQRPATAAVATLSAKHAMHSSGAIGSNGSSVNNGIDAPMSQVDGG